MNELPFESVKREILVRKEADTSEKFGCKPEKRTVNELIDFGIVNIDKPKGPTSHQVSAFVQQILGIKKSGHAGTLDPGVVGVLPVAVGRATRIVRLLLTAGKEYVGVTHLHEEVHEGKLVNAIKKFVGKIEQVPPVKSAVKRQLRERQVYYFNVLEVDEKDVLFRVGCEAGTYIRKLCSDLGKKMNIAANMYELRRTKAGPFKEETLVTLQELADAFWYWKEEGKEQYIRKVVQPIETAVQHLPKIWVFDTTVDSLAHGANLHVPGISKLESGIIPEQIVAVLTLKSELVCYGTAKMNSEDMLGKRGIAVKTAKVFMKPGIYPKFEKA